MKKITVIIIFLICNQIFGQKIAYFDRTFHFKNNNSKSNNRREYTVKDSTIEIKDYKKTKLFRVGIFYGFSNLDNLDEYIYFLSNDNVDRNPKLITENRAGVVKYWFNNLIIEQLWVEENVFYRQVWSDGKEMLINGTGKYENKSPIYKDIGVGIIKDSVIVEEYIVREQKKDTIYSKIDTQAYPIKGIEHFYNQIAKTIDCEKLSRIIEIEKTKIWINFVVDKEGQLTDFFVYNEKKFKFSKKDLKKLESISKWQPATFNGKTVKTRFSIPLIFQPDLIKKYFNVEH
jgi:hypothetical protein